MSKKLGQRKLTFLKKLKRFKENLNLLKLIIRTSGNFQIFIDLVELVSFLHFEQ